MTEDKAMRVDRNSSDPDPATAVLAALQMWQLPFTLYRSWWNSGVEALWGHAHPSHPVRHDEHDQLVVPDPIEADGETALFA